MASFLTYLCLIYVYVCGSRKIFLRILIFSPTHVVDHVHIFAYCLLSCTLNINSNMVILEFSVPRLKTDERNFLPQIIKDHGQQTLPDNTTLSARFRTLVSKEGLQCCEAAGYPKCFAESFVVGADRIPQIHRGGLHGSFLGGD